MARQGTAYDTFSGDQKNVCFIGKNSGNELRSKSIMNFEIKN